VCSTTFSWNADLATNIGVVRALKYIPAPDNLIASGGEDQLLRVWTLSPFSSTAFVLKGHDEAIWSLEWIPEYNVLASGSGDGTIRFWPLDVLQGSAGSCSVFGRSNDGDCLGSEGQHVVSWRDAGIEKRHQVHSLVWASSISQLISGWSDTRIRTWRYDAEKTAPDCPWVYNGYLQSQDRVFDMVWLPSSSQLGTASPDERYPRLWNILNASDQEETATTTEGSDNDTVSNASVPTPPDPDSTSNASLPTPYTYLHGERCASEGIVDCPFAHGDAVLALVAGPTGDVVASGSMDNSVILWDVNTKNRLSQITGHDDYVSSLVWLDTEAKIASGSQDNKIRVWTGDSSDQSTALETLTRHSGAVNALAWVSSGSIVSGSSDGSVVMWNC
jgi:WD40 repeat protein